MSGNEWMAYMLAKEIAWQAVDQAFCMEDVATWQEWSYDVPGSNSENVSDEIPECGTTQPNPRSTTLAILKKGGEVVEGEGSQKPKCKNNRGKSKLPGVSASQKSVCEFFKKENVSEAGVSSKCENAPDRQTVVTPKTSKYYEIQGGE